MRANVKSSSVVLVALVAIFTSGCSDQVVQVEIADAVDKKIYIEMLEKNSFDCSIDERGFILVRAKSFEELDAKMKEYKEWRNARLKSEGVTVPES